MTGEQEPVMALTAKQDVIAALKRSARQSENVAADEAIDSPFTSAHLAECAVLYREVAEWLEDRDPQ